LAFLSALLEIQALETRVVGLDEAPESGERGLSSLRSAANHNAT
jgi:hypothetical protein